MKPSTFASCFAAGGGGSDWFIPTQSISELVRSQPISCTGLICLYLLHLHRPSLDIVAVMVDILMLMFFAIMGLVFLSYIIYMLWWGGLCRIAQKMCVFPLLHPWFPLRTEVRQCCIACDEFDILHKLLRLNIGACDGTGNLQGGNITEDGMCGVIYMIRVWNRWQPLMYALFLMFTP